MPIITRHSQLPSASLANPVSFMKFTMLSPRLVSCAPATNGVNMIAAMAAIPNKYFLMCFILNDFTVNYSRSTNGSSCDTVWPSVT